MLLDGSKDSSLSFGDYGLINGPKVFVLDEFFVGEEILNLGDWRKMVFPEYNGGYSFING